MAWEETALVLYGFVICFRLLDVSHNNVTDREIRVNLVFEFIDQDLSTYLARCPSPGLGPDRIRVSFPCSFQDTGHFLSVHTES